jgi:hypothetical protein
MGTRAVYTFKDKHESFNVYKHYDGYPEGEGAGPGAYGFIKAAKEFAWDLPRFEASDFAAAFIAANKQPGGGDIYFTDSYKNHGDLEYRYEITAQGKNIVVQTFKVEEYDEGNNPVYSPYGEITL